MGTIARFGFLPEDVDISEIPIASLKTLELALATELISKNTACLKLFALFH